MAQITASLVKSLRERTGAGMMDCKKALSDCDGNMEVAVDWLRKKGLAAAAKKAGRVAAEGLIGVATNAVSGAVVEVNAETDFVARNETFQDFVETVAGVALEQGAEMEKVKLATFPGGADSMEDRITQLISTIGENIQVRRAAGLSIEKGVVASYVHTTVRPGLGRIGVLVGLESEADTEKLLQLGKQLAMHVAAANPQYLAIGDVDADVIDREKDVLAEQARSSGKPEEIVHKMVEGRLRKFYEEVVLLEQEYVIQEKTKVSKAVEDLAKLMDTDIQVTGFVRFALGEGIKKDETDFAAEVAEAVGG